LGIDARRLKRVQTAAQSTNGQVEAIQYANMLASEEANQLLQIRAALLAQQNMDAARAQAIADREAKEMAANRTFRSATPQPSAIRAW
jgi:P-type conjugative transfer protein TrbJ